MALTPLHLGPGLFLGVLTLKYLNLWVIILASVLVDIEPLFLLIINPCYHCPHHGFFHSFLGGFFGSLILAIILGKLRKKIKKIFPKFNNKQSFSFPVVFFSSFFAWNLHVFVDSLTHFDVYPFWPSKFNPFLIATKFYWPLNFFYLILLIFFLFYLFKKIISKKLS